MARNTVALPVETVSMVRAAALKLLPEALKAEAAIQKAKDAADQKIMPTFFQFAQEAVKLSGNSLNGAKERFAAICREAEKTILIKQFGEEGYKDARITEVLPSWNNFKSRVNSSFENHGDKAKPETYTEAVMPTKVKDASDWTKAVNDAYKAKLDNRGARGQNQGRQLPEMVRAELDILNKVLWKFSDEALTAEIVPMLNELNVKLGVMLEGHVGDSQSPKGEKDLPARSVKDAAKAIAA